MQDIRFGFQAAAADVAGVPDDQLYRDLIADCALGHKLGYDAAWLLEHHFSDYYPTPSPLLMMAYIAAKFPDLSLGTSVLVLPWYHPLRLAEEIAMLNSLTQGTLHLGIGRGTAKMEYDAYNIDMNEGRARFSEVFKIVETGIGGKAVQRIADSSGTSSGRSAFVPIPSTRRCISTARSAARRAPK